MDQEKQISGFMNYTLGNNAEHSLLEVFGFWLERYRKDRAPSPNTVKSIRSTMRRFLFFCQNKGRENLNQITREDVIEWINSLVNVRTSSRKEAARHISLFFNRALAYGMRMAKLPEIGYRGPADVPRATMKGFTEQEWKTMMLNTKKLGNREKAIFYLLSMRPMRQQELLNLKVEDVSLEAKMIGILKSKNRGSRTIDIPQEAYDAISELIQGKGPKESVFGIASRTMNEVINGIIESLGVKRNGRSSHAFRHTVIIKMLRGLRMDPAVVAEVAGNSTKTIYEHYDKAVTIDEQRHAQRQIDLLARGKIKEVMS